MGNTGLEKALEETLAVFEWLCKEGKNNIDSDENGIIIKEENVKIKLVLPILKCLGWDIIKDIDFEFSIVPKFIDIEHFKERKVRVDCCFMKNGKPVLLLDVKAFKNKSKIDKESELQLKSYCISKNIPCGVITDGFRWVLYGFFAGKVDADIETSN